jgi:magnesium transporter
MIDALVYREETVRELPVETAAELDEARRASGTTWIRATDASHAEIDRVAEAFDLHPLTVDAVRSGSRATAEEYDAYTFLLVKDAELRRGEQTFEEEIDDTPVGIYIGPDWLLTLAVGPVPAVDTVRSRVASGDERLLQRGADFTAYRVVDALVDEYFEILDQIETGIERIESDVIETTELDVLDAINTVRRDLLAFRKLAWPMREAVNVLARGDPAHVDETTEKYFSSVADHLVQVVDLTETYRELVRGTRDIYLNTLSQSTNEVMKQLTVVATIVLPLTFVAGVYGMNFAESPYNMPELTWRFGYPAVLLGMAAITAVMIVYFRRREWI